MHSAGLSPETEDSLNHRMGSTVPGTHDLECVKIYGVGVLSGCIHPIVQTGFPEVALGDVPLVFCNGVGTACVVDRIGHPEACQVVDSELTGFFSNEQLGDMVPQEGLELSSCYVVPPMSAFNPYMVVMRKDDGGT